MDDRYGLVSLQIYYLILFGVWPLWKRPFKKYKIKNITVAVYNLLLILLWTLYCIQNIRYRILDDSDVLGLSFIIVFLQSICEFILKLSIVHISIWKYDKLLQSLLSLRKFRVDNKRLIIILLLITLLFVSFQLVFTSWWLSMLINDNMLQIFVNATDVEKYISAASLVLYTYPNINFIPLIIILGFSLAVQDEFRNLQTQLSKATASKEIYNIENIFHILKLKFEKICDVVICIDETFRHYIAMCSVNVGVFLFVAIYNKTSSCFPTATFVATMTLNALSVLTLYISGTLVNKAVSKVCGYSSKKVKLFFYIFYSGNFLDRSLLYR